MEYVEFILNNIFFVLLEGAVILVLFLTILDDLDFLRAHWFKSLLFLIAYCIFNQIFSQFDLLPHSLIYISFCILALAYITKVSLYTSIAANIIVFLIYTATEAVVAMPVVYFMECTYSVIKNDARLCMTALIIIRPIQTALIILFTRLHIKPTSIEQRLFKKDSLVITHSLLLVFFITVFFTYISRHIHDTVVLLVSSLLFLTVILLSILDKRERIKLMEIENKFLLQEEYSKNMEQIVDAIRKEKHEFKNHISTLVALCTMSEPGVRDKIKSYALKLTNSENFSELHFYNTGNKYLDGLLSVKNNMAVSNGIYFEVNVEATLESIAVDDVDLTSIVGNILDNAFEAVLMNPPEKKKIVSLYIFNEDNRCCISISNNGSAISEKHKKHIFDYKYSTKKKGEGERGYGLYIVKELVTRNKGEISFHSDELETEFLVAFQYKDIVDIKLSQDNKSLSV